MHQTRTFANTQLQQDCTLSLHYPVFKVVRVKSPTTLLEGACAARHGLLRKQIRKRANSQEQIRTSLQMEQTDRAFEAHAVPRHED